MSISTAEKLQNTQAALARARSYNQTLEDGLMGTLAATGGGLLGAVVKKYVPAIIPGEAADGPVVGLIDLAVTGMCLWSGEPAWMALGYGMHGYMSGSAVEKVLP